MGKQVTLTGVNIDGLLNGPIVENGGPANMIGPPLQIGALKVVGAEG